MMAFKTEQITQTYEGKLFPGKLKVYPNPSPGMISFEFSDNLPQGELNISIINSGGLLVYTRDLKALPGRKLDIDIKGVAGGLYIYIVTNKFGKVIYSGTFVIR